MSQMINPNCGRILSGHAAHHAKFMKTRRMLVGLGTCCMLSGCAHDHLESSSKVASKPATGIAATPPAASAVAATNGALFYQWVRPGTRVMTNQTDGTFYLISTNQ